jgi:hypothetical protein
MTSNSVEANPPVGVTADMIDNQQSGNDNQQSGNDNHQSEEEHEYMRGWALTSLTMAFMSICFVLALDNTILGSCFPPDL